MTHETLAAAVKCLSVKAWKDLCKPCPKALPPTPPPQGAGGKGAPTPRLSTGAAAGPLLPYGLRQPPPGRQGRSKKCPKALSQRQPPLLAGGGAPKKAGTARTQPFPAARDGCS